MSRIRVLNQHRFLRDVMGGTALRWLAFGWALVGLLTIPLLLWVRSRRREQLDAARGALDGIALLMPWAENPLDARTRG